MAKPSGLQTQRALRARLNAVLDECRRMQQQFDKWEGIRNLDPESRVGDGAVQQQVAEMRCEEISVPLERAKGEIVVLEQAIAAAED
jgi:hypothetical protein